MKTKVNILCMLLLVSMLFFMASAIPSGAMLDEQKFLLEEEMSSETPDESSWLRFLIPSASAQAASFDPLPLDFSPGHAPNPAGFSENGYKDDSIEVVLSTTEKDNVVWRVANITISHPSQLRTATAGGARSNRVALISAMAEKNNAVIAINADYMANDPAKTSFEYRMGEKVRNKYNNAKDLLIIDENADFHIFIGKNKKQEVDTWLKEGHEIINAFTFGPALVQNDTMLAIPEHYSYNPHGTEPRMAIGQIDTLNYVLVLAEGRTQNSQGATQQQLAEFMFSLGCSQAFNLDGGNSATMVFNGGYYQDKSKDNERPQSDMIYFATLVPEDKR